MEHLYWLQVISVLFIHAITLGTILASGIFVPSLAELSGRPEREITFIFGIQYCLFLSMAIFMRKSLWYVSLLTWCIGYVISIHVVDRYDVFFAVICTFSGLSAGLLYWMSNESYLSLTPPSSSSSVLATGLVSLGSVGFLLIYPAWVTKPINWSKEITSLTINGSVIVGLAIMTINYTNDLLRKENNKGSTTKQQQQQKEPPQRYLVFGCYLIGMFASQAAYFIPFSTLTYQLDSLNIQPMSLISSVLGGGSCIGRVTTTVIVTQHVWLKPYLQAAYSVITLCSIIIWIFAKNTDEFVGFGIMYGFATGGQSSLTFQVLRELCGGKPQQLKSHLIALSISLTLGSLFSALINRYAFSTIYQSIIYTFGMCALSSVAFIIEALLW